MWESILELSESNPLKNIIFYTKDNGFKDLLYDEFRKLVPNAVLNICNSENEIQESLEAWAKSIDEYSYIPEIAFEEHPEIKEWIMSPDCEIQLIGRDWGLLDKSQIVVGTVLHVISVDNIELIDSSETHEIYSADLTISIEYSIKNGTNVEEEKEIHMIVNRFENNPFSIEDVYWDLSEA